MTSTGATVRFGLRSARVRAGRILATVLAVAMATALAVAAFGLAAQLERLLGTTGPATTIEQLLPEGTVVVTAGTPGATEPTAISDVLVERVAAVPGVLDASGTYEQPIGVRIERGSQDERPPMLRGLVFSAEWDPARWQLRRGVAPTGELVAGRRGPAVPVAMDLGGLLTAQAGLGDTIRLQTPTGGVDAVIVAELEDLRLATANIEGTGRGTSVLPSNPAPVASAHVVVERGALVTLLGAQGRVDRITVTPEPGLATEELRARLREVLPADLRIRSAADPEVAEARAVGAVSDGIVTVTWVVAALAALVAALLVANTWSIVASQRSLEVALARCIGMSRRQVVGSFLVEAGLVGSASAVLGLALGVPLSVLAARILHPDTDVDAVLSTAMVAAGVGVGLVVTLLAAVVPAWRVSRVSPMAALDGGRARRAGRSVLLALVLPLLGVLRTAARRPVLRMAAGQPARDPRRASAVVSTLFVSLLLVAAVLTVSSSVRSSIEAQYVSRTDADLVLRRRGVVRVDARALEARLGAEGRSGYVDLSRVEGSLRGPAGVEPVVRSAPLAEVVETFDLELTEDRTGLAALDGGVLLSTTSAGTLGVDTGDLVTLRSTSGTDLEVPVRGTYRNSALAGTALVDQPVARGADAEGSFELAAIRLRDDAAVQEARRWIDRNIGGFNRLDVDTPDAFAATDTDIADTVTRLVLVLLAGTLALGTVGAANNIALSVAQRRQELSMLRAVGAGRRQVRALVTVEAMLLCGSAGLLGVALGAGLGLLALGAAPPGLATAVAVPWWGLAGVVAGAVALGWLAAAAPAIAAARRSPLDGLGDA